METDLLTARIQDTADICIKSSKPKYLGFLSAAEAVLAEQTLKNAPCRIALWGGYSSAERVMLACFPDWMEKDSYPIAALTFKFRESDKLSHRDFLGSLMALGIKRETVGDILTDNGKAVIFVAEDVKEYIKTQIAKIGRVGVTVTDGFTAPLPESDRLENFSDTIASDRIDCVISSLCGFSRSKASEILNLGIVTVNSVAITKPTKAINSGDIISVRGKGRFVINSLDGRTKKNRIIIKYSKYV